MGGSMPLKNLLLVALLTLTFSTGRATPPPLKLGQVVKLSDFKGQTCLEMMRASGGIIEALDADTAAEFTFTDLETFQRALDNFAPSVTAKASRLFKKGVNGLYELVEAQEGKTATPATSNISLIRALEKLDSLKPGQPVPLVAAKLRSLLAITSGAGTLVKVNKDNYVYHVGYLPATNDRVKLAKHVKSGRSYSASPARNAVDPTDVEYLKDLEDLLDSSRDVAPFFRTMFDVLLKSDASGYKNLTDEGQNVITDFYAVYVAEFTRSFMSGLKSHPWQNDLAEVTMLSAYGSVLDKIYLDGKFQTGTAHQYFGIGNNGTGIGVTRRDRRTLQQLVSQAEKTLNPAIVADLEKFIGQPRNGDLIHGLMVYLNDPRNQVEITENATELNKAIVNFLVQIREDAAEITKVIQRQVRKAG